MAGSRRFFALLALAALLTLAACAAPASNTTGGGGGTSGGTTVSLQNLAFNPSTLTVQTGTTVTFKNDDQVPHQIVVGSDDLGQQAPGESKTWTAPKDGDYEMRCVIHPSMTGRITVGAGGASGGGTGNTTGNTSGGGTGNTSGGSGTASGSVPGY